MKAVFTCWVEYLGAPINILSDNVSEFPRELSGSLGDFDDIKLFVQKLQKSESLWNIGLWEQLNGILSLSN